MTSNPDHTSDGLVGRWFYSKSWRRKRGRIEERVREGLYLVDFEGDAYAVLVPVDTMVNEEWQFFTDQDLWHQLVAGFDEEWAAEFKEELAQTSAALRQEIAAVNSDPISRPSRRVRAERKAKRARRVPMVKDEGLWAEIKPMVERGMSQRDIRDACKRRGRKISLYTVNTIIAARRLGLEVLEGGKAG